MPIVDKTDYNAIDAYTAERIKNLEKALIRTLKWCAESIVNTARVSHTYKDQTGNLTSSIGAVIVVDGHIEWQSSFEVVKQGGQGAKDGLEFAKSLVKEFPKGIALIVVAGKNYAVHVSNRGYDVIDSAELESKTLIPQMLQSLKI